MRLFATASIVALFALTAAAPRDWRQVTARTPAGTYLTGNPAQEKRLVGIVTEEITERGRKSLLITRIAVLLEFLRQSFGLSIPNFRKVKVNLRGRPVPQ